MLRNEYVVYLVSVSGYNFSFEKKINFLECKVDMQCNSVWDEEVFYLVIISKLSGFAVHNT